VAATTLDSVTIAENLAQIREAVAEACARAGRSESDVQLMAVSKNHPVEALLEAYAAGQRLFGENRVQEAQGKLPALADCAGLELHLIGPLQSNKAAKAAETFATIQTVDSVKIASRLQAACEAVGSVLPIYVEVKLSPEDSKHGVEAAAVGELLNALAALANLSVRGLMTVPPFTENPEGARPYFARLRALRDAHRRAFPSLAELSMGMSHDFVIAIEEGSTMVRVGTAIFGARV
jgi:pyridoxal phosphate enzyme (YggS family)